jgi:hypothetical protein
LDAQNGLTFAGQPACVFRRFPLAQRALCGGTLGVFEPGAKEQHAVKDGPGILAPDTISRDHKPEEDSRAGAFRSAGARALAELSHSKSERIQLNACKAQNLRRAAEALSNGPC